MAIVPKPLTLDERLNSVLRLRELGGTEQECIQFGRKTLRLTDDQIRRQLDLHTRGTKSFQMQRAEQSQQKAIGTSENNPE
jgi:hypothetical protein